MNALTRSALPFAANWSISSLPMRPTISSSQRASAFCENAFDTSDRSLPCTGSSMPSITPWPSTSPKIWITHVDENVSLSRNICWMSSCGTR